MAKLGSPNPQMEAGPLASAQGSLPHFTSTSTLFEIDLPGKLACQIYSQTAAKIKLRRKELLGNSTYDFQNGASITYHLEELALFAHSQYFDAEKALKSQKLRHAKLWKEEEPNKKEYARVELMLDSKLLDILRVEYFKFWQEHDRQITAMELSETTKEWSHQKSRLESLVESHISACQVLRRDMLSKIDSPTEVTSDLLSGLTADEAMGHWRQWKSGIYPIPLSRPVSEVKQVLQKVDDMHPAYCERWSNIKRGLPNSYQKIGEIRKYVVEFKRLERQCRSDLEFSKGLAFFTAPLRFLDFPREIRDEIYAWLLLFPYNLTEKRSFKKKRGCRNGFRGKVCLHPLFHASTQVRREARDCLYGRNTFAPTSLLRFLRYPTESLELLYRSLITRLSLTWASLDRSSVHTLKALKQFKSLRFLKIYLNWENLSGRTTNTLDGIAAFEFVADGLISHIKSIEKIEIFEVLNDFGREGKTLRELAQARRERNYPPSLTDRNLAKQRFRSLGRREFVLHYFGSDSRTGKSILEMEKKYDREFKQKVLHAQIPGTVYSMGRLPLDPLRKWEAKWEAAIKEKREKEHEAVQIGRERVRLMETSFIRSQLENIRNQTRKRRSDRINLLAFATHVTTEDKVLDAFWGSYNSYFSDESV